MEDRSLALHARRGLGRHGAVAECAGDFRVQHEFGGSEQIVEPTPAERSFAERALALCPGVPAYARVDIVTTADGPVLMEIELIEPCLYLAHHHAAADRFARAILARV